jgi:ribosome-associated protein
MIRVDAQHSIPEEALTLEFIRSSGPGGQNVNKVATAVQLTLHLARCPGLEGEVRQRLAAMAGRRLTADGRLTIVARRHRTQERNRDDALERLLDLLRRALLPHRPRRPTRPSATARERRLEAKRRRSVTKGQRRPAADEMG